MSEGTYFGCKHCPARFDGEGSESQLKAHNEGFHPAGAPVARLLDTPAAVAAVGQDFGPAVLDIASDLGAVKGLLEDLQERVKALEEGQRSAETPTEPERAPYADLQARAKELDIPATGTYEALQAAIAAEDLRLAGGTQGGDASPVDDPAALATGEAGTPPEK